MQGAAREGFGALRDTGPWVPCWVRPPRRARYWCLLAGSTGPGKPAAWLGFCLVGYLRVFSRVCQPWPPPCFHKHPLQKELVDLGCRGDAISTGEIHPARPGCARGQGQGTGDSHIPSPCPRDEQSPAPPQELWDAGDVSQAGGTEHPAPQGLRPRVSWEMVRKEAEEPRPSNVPELTERWCHGSISARGDGGDHVIPRASNLCNISGLA